MPSLNGQHRRALESRLPAADPPRAPGEKRLFWLPACSVESLTTAACGQSSRPAVAMPVPMQTPDPDDCTPANSKSGASRSSRRRPECARSAIGSEPSYRRRPTRRQRPIGALRQALAQGLVDFLRSHRDHDHLHRLRLGFLDLDGFLQGEVIPLRSIANQEIVINLCADKRATFSEIFRVFFRVPVGLRTLRSIAGVGSRSRQPAGRGARCNRWPTFAPGGTDSYPNDTYRVHHERRYSK